MSEEEKKAIETLEIEGTENNYLEVRILLNLAEKQQKEIEALEIIQNTYKEMIEENDYISKDKIRAKIKELEQFRDKNVLCNSHDFFGINRIIKVLEELLEEN